MNTIRILVITLMTLLGDGLAQAAFASAATR